MNEQNGMDTKITFEWHSLIRDIVHNIWVILLAAITGFMAVYIAAHSIYSPTYTSSATLIVRVKTGTSTTYSTLTSATEMADIFTNVFKQKTMKDYAAENLGLSSFDGSISASAIENTNIMTVSVTSADPERSYELLRSVLEVYPKISDNVFDNAVIDVISTPKVPMSASNSISVAKEILVALAVAVLTTAGVVVLSLFRDTVKSEADFEEKIDSSLIGSVVHERKEMTLRDVLNKRKKSLLINNAFTSFHFTESFKKIAAKLDHMRRRHGDKVFIVASIAENEGKSTTAANIAIALAERGFSVLLLDMDFKKPALHKVLDTEIAADSDLGLLLSGETQPKNYKLVRYHKTKLYLGLNQKAHPSCGTWLSGTNTQRIISAFRKSFDFVIIDTPPMATSADATSMLGLADRLLLVVRTDIAHTADINDTILQIKSTGGKFAGCILNDVYKEFSMFGQAGYDENGYYAKSHGYHGYYGYSKYKKYSGYGAYADNTVIIDDGDDGDVEVPEEKDQ